MQTRITVLTEDLAEAEAVLKRAQERVEHVKFRLSVAKDHHLFARPLTCSGCGTAIRSELEMSEHYRVTDRRYPNLGECPNKEARNG